MDYKQSRRYFDTWNWVLLVGGSLVGLALLYFYILAGIVIVLGLGTYIFFKLHEYPTDEEIDDMVGEQIQEAIARGYERLGINRLDVSKIEPIVLHGPSLKEIVYQPVLKRGKDQHVRSSSHEITVYYFGQKHLYTYQCQLSLVDDEIKERTNEVNYKDILSMSTRTTSTRYYEGRYQRAEQFDHHTFKLVVGGFHELTCALLDKRMIENEVFALINLWREREGEHTSNNLDIPTSEAT